MVSKYSGFEVQSQQLGSSFGLAFGRVDGWQHIMSGMQRGAGMVTFQGGKRLVDFNPT